MAEFQPTRPLRGATISPRSPAVRTMNFNPRAPCGARRMYQDRSDNNGQISTHAPLAGRDVDLVVAGGQTEGISTHAPLAGRDIEVQEQHAPNQYFNPRAPCGARLNNLAVTVEKLYFNPRAPCGARRAHVAAFRPDAAFQPTRPLRGATQILRAAHGEESISTHAPLAGRDTASGDSISPKIKFQPTRPLRGATAKVYKSLCTFLR